MKTITQLAPPTGLSRIVLTAVLSYADENEHWPTTAEVSEALATATPPIAPDRVRWALWDLAKRGWLERHENAWRCPQATLSLEYDTSEAGTFLRGLLEG